MHLAVFGGTFDPPHNGHLALCLFARELLAIDRLIVSVSNNPFKPERGAPDVHRKRMVELLSSEINGTGDACSEVSGWELEKQQPSYTVDLLNYVHALYPHDRLTLLVGEDSFREFHSWKDYEKLFSLCDIAVFRRASTEVNTLPSGSMPRNGGIELIDFDYPLSSTDIRELVSSGQSISGLVPPAVRRYIIEQGLYRKPLSSAT
ncbi:MAG: nicotinate (nicotinamide) nucleotide adenylyltransferase [Chlorobium sp.]|nr:MAG: nicotinate (nicotinamide) nucleotide adenylyltransferase [Chlorobium sp.]